MTTIENAKKTQSMIHNIVRLIKYKFTRENEIVTLKEELMQIENLIEIFRTRFRENLVFDNYIKDEWTDIYIPNYMIMAFVENALYHGLTPEEGEWRLAITGKENEGYLEIQVIDSGIGFDASIVNVEKKSSDITNKKIGSIPNILSRMQDYYKNDAHVKIFSFPGRGTRVMITIPNT